MLGQILKIQDASENSKPNVYIFFPENIFELIDTSEGCLIRYSNDKNIDVVAANVTARQMKRSIQESLKEDHELGFLKLESNYHNHKGVRYINVKHIAGLLDNGNNRCDIHMEYHNRFIRIEESGQEVAAQIRRVIKGGLIKTRNYAARQCQYQQKNNEL